MQPPWIYLSNIHVIYSEVYISLMDLSLGLSNPIMCKGGWTDRAKAFCVHICGFSWYLEFKRLADMCSKYSEYANSGHLFPLLLEEELCHLSP